MKKKRKKNVLLCSLNQGFESCNFAPRMIRNNLSAPDEACSLDTCENEIASCSQFFNDLFVKYVKEDGVILRVFIHQIAEKSIVSWNTSQVNDKLYIEIPLNASKESFITLLEYAEENLGLSEVVACIAKKQHNYTSTVKAFQFMGFQIINEVTGKNEYNITSSTPFLCLGYELD